MNPESKSYTELNKRWKATCRLVIGGEVGELESNKKIKWDIYNIGRRM